MEYITKFCEFCGSAVMCGNDEKAEDVCNCEGAKHRRELLKKQSKLKAAVEMCCGEDCEKYYPLHKPLCEDELDALYKIVDMICGELIYSATITLTDGTSMKLSQYSVKRKATSKRKESV